MRKPSRYHVEFRFTPKGAVEDECEVKAFSHEDAARVFFKEAWNDDDSFVDGDELDVIVTEIASGQRKRLTVTVVVDVAYHARPSKEPLPERAPPAVLPGQLSLISEAK